jgi:hypothetical protein
MRDDNQPSMDGLEKELKDLTLWVDRQKLIDAEISYIARRLPEIEAHLIAIRAQAPQEEPERMKTALSTCKGLRKHLSGR